MSIVRVWKPSARSSSSRRSRKAGQRKPLAASSIDRGAAIWSLTSMRRAKPHGNAPCPAILPCLLPNADSMRSVLLATEDASAGRWCACAPQRAEMHTRQWVGTYAGKGNGDYRGELASALRAIIAYLKHFAFPPEMALIRLDGAYGDATVVAQLLLASTPSVPRWRGYLLLEHPQIQRVLAHAPTASMARMN